jgi:hypothetical protein
MGARFHFLILAMFLSLNACSLYQSKGRKFLEGNAYQFAGVAAFAESCGPVELTSDWQEIERTGKNADQNADQARAFQAKARDSSDSQNPVELQVVNSSGTRSCLYAFKSQKQLEQQLEKAIEYSLLNFSLGEFAFRH